MSDLWNEPLFNAVINALDGWVFTLDPQGVITGIHQASDLPLSLRAPEILGKTLEQVFPSAVSLAFRTALQAQKMTQAPQTLGYFLEEADGPRHFRASLAEIQLEGHGPLCLVVNRDVTGQTLAQKVSHEHELVYQLLAQNATDIISVQTVEGVLRYVSPSAARVLGYTSEETIGQNIKTYIHPEDLERLRAKYPNLMPPEDRAVVQQRLRHSDGHWVHVETEVQKIEWLGEVALLSSTRDISYRRQAEEKAAGMVKELEDARQRAESANRAKSDFITGISHDLRTPLHGLLGMAELLAQTHLTQEQQEYLAAIQESGDTLLARLNDLLDLSKIESGQLDLQQADFDLVEAVEGLADILGSQATDKGLLLFCHVHPEVPSVVRGDQHRLRQVLINLIGNAIKFTEDGEVDVRVTGCADGKLRFSVRDTGIGISPKNMDRILGRVEAVEPSKSRLARKQPRMGIGLTIAKQLVALMGGELKLKSREGQGSTFYFDLHLPASTRQITELKGNELAGQRILAADENATNRQLIREILEQSGADVELAGGGVETIRNLLDQPTFHCVILSANLPDLDGLATAAMIRSNRTLEKIPLVMMISSAEKDEVERCKELKINATLTKPVGRDVLVRAVQEVVNFGGFSDTLTSRANDSTILVVEDNEVNLRLARDILQRAGYSVVSARDGKEALRQLAHHAIDAVLMDIQLPDMDGIEATARIRKTPLWAAIPIIAMTAHAMKGHAEQFLQAGVDNCLSKPVNQMELLGVLEQELKKRRAVSTAPVAKQ